jgi:hypothetical protein
MASLLNKYKYLLVLLVFTACNDTEYQLVPPHELINDNSSKVWIVKSKKKDGVELNEIIRAKRMCFTFYRNYKVVANKLHNFGSYNYQDASYQFQENGSELVFTWGGRNVQVFDIEKIDVQNIILVDKRDSSRLHLIPLDFPKSK